MDANDVKKLSLQSDIFVAAETLVDLLDLPNLEDHIEEIKSVAGELSSYVDRAGYKPLTITEALELARQVEMPKIVIVNDEPQALEEWLLEKDPAICADQIEDLYHKCLAFGLEVAPTFLYDLWTEYSSAWGAGWIDSTSIPTVEVYQVVKDQITRGGE